MLFFSCSVFEPIVRFFSRLFTQDDSSFLIPRDQRHEVTQTEEQPNMLWKCRVSGEEELASRARWIGRDGEDKNKL